MNPGKKKICVVITSRASYARVKSVLNSIERHPRLELQLIVGASALLYRFGTVIDIIRKDGFEPDSVVYSVVEGENPATMAKTTGLSIVELVSAFDSMRPDVVLTVADRYETLATAIAAGYMNIPVAHLQGGEVTGSIDESVRHAVTKLAHIHFPATEKSAERIIKMGEKRGTVFNVGCPSIDIARTVDKKKSLAKIMARYGGAGGYIDWEKPFLLVLQHAVTTEYDSGFSQINETIKAISKLRLQAVWMWPNIDAGSDDISKGIRMWREKENPDFVHFYRNFTPEDYLKVLYHASCIVGNSSSGIREGSYTGTPCVNIGTRQNGRERAKNVVDAAHDAAAIEEAVRSQIKRGKYPSDRLYGDGNSGKRIASILASEKISVQKQMAY